MEQSHRPTVGTSVLGVLGVPGVPTFGTSELDQMKLQSRELAASSVQG